MTKSKYDYDSGYFYQRIQENADRQTQENHIVWDEIVTADLGFETSTVLSEVKDGEYRAWSKEENERRNKWINDLLSRACAGVEPEVWKMILEVGPGKVQTQDITFDKIGDKIRDEQCTTVHRLPPNLSALQMWLRHYSQMYRSIESGKLEDKGNSDTPADASHGIDIGRWIEKEVGDD